MSNDYDPPEECLSPKTSVFNLKVLVDGGKDEISIAAMDYGAEPFNRAPSIGIRWNGHPGAKKGNPTSRGHPTWFILPDWLAEIVKANLDKGPNILKKDEK